MLRDALEKLAAVAVACAPVKVEIIIVNNASHDGTAKVIEQFVQHHPDLKPVAVFAAKPGLAAARNAGLRVARGGIIAFCDDDAVPAPDYFTVLARLYAHDTKPAMRGGRVLLGDPHDLPFTIKTETEPARYAGRYPGGFIHGCNMTLSRSLYEAIGAMDERFGAGAVFPSADDTDYLHRAYLAGAEVLYCPELVVHHFHGRRDLAEVRRLFHGYMVGDGALFAKHWRNGLLRCLLGNIRNAARSYWRHELIFEPRLRFTYREAAMGNLRGFCRYVLAALLGALPARAHVTADHG